MDHLRPLELVNVVRRARMIVCDFDGTLVDSNPIKQRAFAECFAEFPDRIDEIMTWCIGRHDLPRGEKFRHVYERLLARPYTPDIAAALHQRFDALTTRQIIDAPAIAGAEEFLRAAHQRGPTALLTTTPHTVLEHIVEQRRWYSYFTLIQGAPVDKAAWLSALQKTWSISRTSLILFGDAREDAEAAAAARCVFVRVGGGPSEREPYAIRDFSSLVFSAQLTA